MFSLTMVPRIISSAPIFFETKRQKYFIASYPSREKRFGEMRKRRDESSKKSRARYQKAFLMLTSRFADLVIFRF